jgi:divalent metal cation (Fe/Co/Zn/Cd) transporter
VGHSKHRHSRSQCRNHIEHFLNGYLDNILQSPITTSIGVLAAVVIIADTHKWINHTTALEILSVIIGAGFSMMRDD